MCKFPIRYIAIQKKSELGMLIRLGTKNNGELKGFIPCNFTLKKSKICRALDSGFIIDYFEEHLRNKCLLKA